METHKQALHQRGVSMDEGFLLTPSTHTQGRRSQSLTTADSIGDGRSATQSQNNSSEAGSGNDGGSSGASSCDHGPQFLQTEADTSSPQQAGVSNASVASSSDASPIYKALHRDGPASTVGSKTHPNCRPCAFYCYSMGGCRSGEDCQFCHLVHMPSRRRRNKTTEAYEQSATTDVKANVPATCFPRDRPVSIAFAAAAKKDPTSSSSDPMASVSNASSPDMGPARQIRVAVPIRSQQARPAPELVQERGGNEACMSPQYAEPVLLTIPAPITGRDAFVQPEAKVIHRSTSLPPSAQAPYLARPYPAKANSSGRNKKAPSRLFAQTNSSGKMTVAPNQFTYNPESVVVTIGQKVELWPSVIPGKHLMLFNVFPDLPKGLVLEERVGMIYGRAMEPTKGSVTFIVTARITGNTLAPVMVAVVVLKVIDVRVAGHHVTHIVSPEPGVTIVTLKEDTSDDDLIATDSRASLADGLSRPVRPPP